MGLSKLTEKDLFYDNEKRLLDVLYLMQKGEAKPRLFRSILS
jgi:hypothetical protein